MAPPALRRLPFDDTFADFGSSHKDVRSEPGGKGATGRPSEKPQPQPQAQPGRLRFVSNCLRPLSNLPARHPDSLTPRHSPQPRETPPHATNKDPRSPPVPLPPCASTPPCSENKNSGKEAQYEMKWGPPYQHLTTHPKERGCDIDAHSPSPASEGPTTWASVPWPPPCSTQPLARRTWTRAQRRKKEAHVLRHATFAARPSRKAHAPVL